MSVMKMEQRRKLNKYNKSSKTGLLILILILCTFVTACGKNEEKKKPVKLEEFNDKSITIGVVSDYIFDKSVEKALPNAKIKYFDNRDNAYRALVSGVVDGVADDEPIIRSAIRSTDELILIDGYLEPSDYGFVFPKDEEGKKLCEEFSEYLSEIRENGNLAILDEKWFGNETNNKTSEDYSKLPAKNKVIKMAYEENNIPFVYMSAGKPVGYEIDLAIGFCKKYGYGLELEKAEFTDLLSGTEAGTYDMGCGSITITEERMEKLYFSVPDYSGGVCICRAKGVVENSPEKSALSSFKRSFKRVFVKDDRYKIFLKGIAVTLLITILSVCVGLPFGLLIYVSSRRSGFIGRGISRFIMWFLQGIPAIMLIMILYYTYYRDMYAGGIIASSLGFGLLLSEKIYAILERYGAGADDGMIEKNYRLYVFDTKDYLKKLFAVSGEDIRYDFNDKLITIFKATSVVGYIAVRDMTKVFDILRTESLETGLPLVATTVVYFALIKLISLCLKPRQRKTKSDTEEIKDVR